jgi:DNA (cytosine-5)-methyltransferase 1
VVRAEEFGIPQRRHRVILVGIRSDLAGRELPTLTRVREQMPAKKALAGLPLVRSGLSKAEDSDDSWVKAVKASLRCDWLPQVDRDVRTRIRSVLNNLVAPAAGRGGEFIGKGARPVLNHSTRGHIVEDLHRYLFSSCFADVRGSAPVLAEFPVALLPAHANVRGDASDAVFGDRFRTQVSGEPSTTVTSHISKDGHYYIHPDPSQCRSLTVREAARLQTFPDDYFFCGPRTAQYHQVGNAVPPGLAERIAASVAALF